jgi:transcriptional regulator with XRE-family HTH domain
MREWLSTIRKNENVSQKEIADRCNISGAYYCMIENGTRIPSVKTAKLIAKKLHFDAYCKNWTNFFE